MDQGKQKRLRVRWVTMLLCSILLGSLPLPAWATLGEDWTQATPAAAFPARTAHSSVVFNNQMWVIAGINQVLDIRYNDVWNSTDGITWTQVTAAAAFPPRIFHASVVFNNKIWVIGGRAASPMNDVWSSPDGITWTQATDAAAFSARSLHTSVVFDNKIWVIGGLTPDGFVNDVWNSPDGVTWTRVTAAAAFAGRVRHTSVVFNNKIWVIAGHRDLEADSEVWNSGDGITWTKVTAAAAFSPRVRHASVVFNNKIWVIAGLEDILGNTQAKNDVWSSDDGALWSQSTAAAAFAPRSWPTSLVYKDRIWIIAGDLTNGSGNITGPTNDVWYTEFPSPPRNSQHISTTLPSAMTPGQQFTAEIYMQNIGPETWTNADGFKLAVIADDSHLVAGTRFFTIPDRPIPMWSGNVYQIPLTAPLQEGTVTLQFRMVKEFVEFFGETITAQIRISRNGAKEWSLYH